jgi:hypothetical protein
VNLGRLRDMTVMAPIAIVFVIWLTVKGMIKGAVEGAKYGWLAIKETWRRSLLSEEGEK